MSPPTGGPPVAAELLVSIDAVRAYLHAIGRTPLLSAAEEVELAQRIEVGVLAGERLRQAGDGERAVPSTQLSDLRQLERDGGRARTRLLEANLRLVVSIAKRYSGRGMAFLDLVQEGNIGLMRAVERFDYARGYKFSTYATWWIRQAVSRAMADQSRTIRIPAHKAEAITRMARLARELLVQLGRDPTAQELAAELSSTPDDVLELQRLAREPLSLDLTLGPEGDLRLGDLVADSDATTAAEAATFSLMQREIAALLATLPSREAAVIQLRYGLTDGRPRTLDEIGRVYGVTRERIRQIEARTMNKLRHPARIRKLRDYLS